MDNVSAILQQAMRDAAPQFAAIDAVALANQRKVLEAFARHNISERHLKGSTGYGYGDIGRDALSQVFATVLGTQQAIVSPLIACGTHALAIGLYGLLRPDDTLLSITGQPYDTLDSIIHDTVNGGLAQYDIHYRQIDLVGDDIDYAAIADYFATQTARVVYITRSRGYTTHNALSIEAIRQAIAFVKQKAPEAIIFVDNCYGEFCDTLEPTDVGADVIAGSLIKNLGGGLAPTGGYIAGTQSCIQQIGYRFIAPGLGTEVGSYVSGYHYFYQGLFVAPHVVANALKASVLFGHAFALAGFDTVPSPTAPCNDIIRSIRFDTADQLIAFIRQIQAVSPIDSNVVPYPWDMPGYSDRVIMAAGTFVSGASIELSADAPIKEPYIAYLQGALTFEHAYIAVERCLRAILK